MFPWFGKLRLRGEVAFQEAETWRERYEEVKLSLFQEVKDAYYELYYLARAIVITEENLRLLERFERVARRRFEAGQTTSRDLLKA